MRSRRLTVTGFAWAAAGVLAAACSPSGESSLDPVEELLGRSVPSGFAAVEFHVPDAPLSEHDDQMIEVAYQTPMLRTLADVRQACTSLADYVDEFRDQMMNVTSDEPGLDAKGCAATLAPIPVGPLDPLPVPSAQTVSLWEENGVRHGRIWKQHVEYVDAGEFKALRLIVSSRRLGAEVPSGS